MKKALTYNKAFEKLEELIEEFEHGDIQLDKLSDKVKQANELIQFQQYFLFCPF